jgi:Tripartite ATP-independent periplasmic transporter, DctM component
MEKSGISLRLVRFAMALVGHLRGGLQQVFVVTIYLVSGVSGSKAADVQHYACDDQWASRSDPAFGDLGVGSAGEYRRGDRSSVTRSFEARQIRSQDLGLAPA